jgi:hypothetical protein
MEGLRRVEVSLSEEWMPRGSLIMVNKEYAGAKGGGGGGGNVSGDSGADENVQNDGEKRLAEEMLLLRASDKAVLD